MNTTDAIKNKEASLIALMSRILIEPLNPLNQSINDSVKHISEIQDDLEKIDANILSNSNSLDDIKKTLRLSFNEIKEKALPNHTQKFQEQFKNFSDANTIKIQSLIDLQQERIDLLETNIKTGNNDIIQEIKNYQDLTKKVIDDHAIESLRTLTSLQNSAQSLRSEINDQKNHQGLTQKNLFAKLIDATNERSAIQKTLTQLASHYEINATSLARLQESSSAIFARLEDVDQKASNAINQHQEKLIQTLNDQNIILTTQITAIQRKLRTLAITTGMFFVSMLSYIGHELWSKLS